MFFVLWNRPHLSAAFDKIWRESSFHPEDGHGCGILSLISLTN